MIALTFLTPCKIGILQRVTNQFQSDAITYILRCILKNRTFVQGKKLQQ